MQNDDGFDDNVQILLQLMQAVNRGQQGNKAMDLPGDLLMHRSRQSQRDRERRVEMRDTDAVQQIKDAIERWQAKRNGMISHSELWHLYMDA